MGYRTFFVFGYDRIIIVVREVEAARGIWGAPAYRNSPQSPPSRGWIQCWRSETYPKGGSGGRRSPTIGSGVSDCDDTRVQFFHQEKECGGFLLPEKFAIQASPGMRTCILLIWIVSCLLYPEEKFPILQGCIFGGEVIHVFLIRGDGLKVRGHPARITIFGVVFFVPHARRSRFISRAKHSNRRLSLARL